MLRARSLGLRSLVTRSGVKPPPPSTRAPHPTCCTFAGYHVHLCSLTRAPHPGSCTGMGAPPRIFTRGDTYISQHVQKVRPPPVGCAGAAGAAGGDIAVTPYELTAYLLFLSKFLKEYVLCPCTPRSERGAAGPHPASCTLQAVACTAPRLLHRCTPNPCTAPLTRAPHPAPCFLHLAPPTSSTAPCFLHLCTLNPCTAPCFLHRDGVHPCLLFSEGQDQGQARTSRQTGVV